MSSTRRDAMKAAETAASARPSLRGSDIRGFTRLGFDAVVGVTGLVEAMHHTIARRAGVVGAPPPGRTRGITGFVYRTVEGTSRVLGRGVDALLGTLIPPQVHGATTPKREAAIAALNGVFGDHLADTGNPLAIRMAFRVGGVPLDLTAPSLSQQLSEPGARILVLAHGLCMNDLQWQRDGTDHGAELARDCGYTPVYLHYNSGRHVSQNGREFAGLLEALLAKWPVRVRELVIVGHSMGGLVARSACDFAERLGMRWLAALTRLVFLGTPHHGAPMERGGHKLDILFEVSPYVAPFARLGKARSAGITDLRFGNVQDADWRGRDRYHQKHDDRKPLPLPAGVAVYAIAATTGKGGGLRDALVGDGLVPVASALGHHTDPSLALAVPKAHQLVVTSANHFDLLSHPDVWRKLSGWLAPRGRHRSVDRL